MPGAGIRRASASSDSRHWRHEVTKIKSERVILAARPNGAPRPNNFGIEVVELPEIEHGEVLLATRHLSLDPYLRRRMDDRKSYSAPTALRRVPVGAPIARVLALPHPHFSVDGQVPPELGWVCPAVLDG